MALVSVSAQVAGRNVNMVTGGTFPGGDPFLQKQNEPSIAVSSRNPCHLLAGANDYRAVNLPGNLGDAEIGDAWLGWYESTDCGSTWYSTLVPGYRQDLSAEGKASPMFGLSAGADPVVRAGGSGTFYYLFIGFNRGSNVGKLGLARAIDHNDRETFINPYDLIIEGVSPSVGTTSQASGEYVDQRRPFSPIRYVGTTEIARGSAGQFVDKPSMAVFPADTGTCTMDGETVPATNVYMAWTEFVGNSPENLRSKLYFARSNNCGASLVGPATKLSEGYALGQGTAIAVNPKNKNEIYVVWRQIRSHLNSDGLLYVRSLDGGQTFTKAASIPGLAPGQAYQYVPFDQNTTSPLFNSNHTTMTFRTLGYPTLAFTDEEPNGVLYLAYAQPMTPNTTSPFLGGKNSRIRIMRNVGGVWSAPLIAVPPVDENGNNVNGQQIMPALGYAAGRLQLMWNDFRFDESGFINEFLVDEKQALETTNPVPPKRNVRHTMDIMGAQAQVPIDWPSGGTEANFFTLYGVSQPDLNDFPTTRGPRISQYLLGDPDPSVDEGGPRQLQFNFSNLPLYGGGTIAFIGDYNDINGLQFIPNPSEPGKFMLNGKSNVADAGLNAFHAAWTDNRDAKLAPGDGVDAILGYTPVGFGSCNPDNTRTRDANVYTSRITQEFSLTAPTNAKTTNEGVVRTFAVQLTNGTELEARFNLSLNQLADASWSRTTYGNGFCVSVPPNPIVPLIPVTVPKNSSIVRTVYANCSTEAARRIVVTAHRCIATDPITGVCNGTNGMATLVLNGDPNNPATKLGGGSDELVNETHTPDPENPDPENPDPENNPHTPDPENKDAPNPDPENPDPENPDPENPDPENKSVKTPDPENPDPENPDPENVHPHTPDPENPDPENANYQDISVDLGTTGNTTSGFQVQVQTSATTAGFEFVLMGRRLYSTPAALGCQLARYRRNQFLFSIPYDGAILQQGFLPENDPSPENITTLVRQGEKIRLTLRVVWNAKDPQIQPRPECGVDPITGQPKKCFCSPDPTSPFACFKMLEFHTKALAPNTGQTEPDQASFGRTDSIFLSFTAQPADGFTDQTLSSGDGPIAVRAQDLTGASLPGVNVTMALGNNPGDATLGGTLTQMTDESGVARFDNLTINAGGAGYTLLASATDAGTEESDPFDMTQTLVVTNTNDTGPGSLRQAIADAEARAGLDRISFNIPVGAGRVISPATFFQLIDDPVIIDGTTQPEYDGAPVIEVDGTACCGTNPGASGFALLGTASGSTIKGLSITGFGQAAIRLTETDGVVIESNYIGLDLTQAGKGSEHGIMLFGATNTRIGGPFFNQRNFIGGNSIAGIAMRQCCTPVKPSSANLVQGNVIGVEPDDGGVANGSAANETSGGGVVLNEGAFDNRIGGAFDRTAQNEIRGNIGAGVRVTGTAGVNNAIQYNSIGENTLLGIDLGANGITANDTLDPDTGPNNLQNWPTLTGAFLNTDTGDLFIDGTLNSEPNKHYVIDFYSTSFCTGGNRQARNWFGAAIVTTDGSGNATISGGFGGTGVTGGFITATATPTPSNTDFYPLGSTSELSNCQAVSAGPGEENR